MDNRWSTSEKEPFLSDDSLKMRHRQKWDSKLVALIWLTVHVVLFAILGSVLVVTTEHKILEAVSSSVLSSLNSQHAEFGGLTVQHDDDNGPYVICPEGDPSAALQAGCKFDLFANGWSPAPCFDEELHTFFVNQRDYYFWADREKQHRVPQEKILNGTNEYPELFVSFEEHYEHCRYLLNGTLRNARDPYRGILDIYLEKGHLEHCIDFLKESRDPHYVEENVIAYFGYNKCFLPRRSGI